MKEKSRSYKRMFKMPSLYLDDIEKIEHIIVNDLKSEKIKIETPEYEYDSSKEIISVKHPINSLEITSYCPHISIFFNKNISGLYIGNQEDISLGNVLKIENIIKSRERKILWIVTDYIFANVFIASLFIYEIVFSKAAIFFKILPFWLLYDFWAIWFVLHKFSKIKLIHSNDEKNIFNKYTAEITFIGVLFTIITFIYTVIK